MRRTFAILWALVAVASLARAQAQPKRLPGPFILYGPIHTIRDERTTFIIVNGELVESARELVMTVTLNEDATKQEKTLYVNGEIISRTEETYDPDGRILESRLFRKGHDLQSRNVSIYDERKQLIEQIAYRPDDSIYKKQTIQHEGQQMKVETVEYDPQGRIVGQGSAQNDNQTGRLNSISTGLGRTVQSQASTTRNPDGSQEFRVEGTDGYFSRQVIANNNQGGTDRTVYNPDGTIKERVRRIGEFDSYQNLIKSTFLTATGDSSEFRPTTITYRSITYYPKN